MGLRAVDCAGQRSSGGIGEKSSGRTCGACDPVLGINPTKGCICSDQEGQLIRLRYFLFWATEADVLPSADILAPSPLYATCL